jgi:hypothetical protein
MADLREHESLGCILVQGKATDSLGKETREETADHETSDCKSGTTHPALRVCSNSSIASYWQAVTDRL